MLLARHIPSVNMNGERRGASVPKSPGDADRDLSLAQFQRKNYNQVTVENRYWGQSPTEKYRFRSKNRLNCGIGWPGCRPWKCLAALKKIIRREVTTKTDTVTNLIKITW